MIEHDIEEYLEREWKGSADSLFELRDMVLLFQQAQTEIERLRKSETAISQLESLEYFDDWIKLADSWDESPETDFKVFLNNFMESNDHEKPTQILY
jgi:hypothetical protein